MTAFRAMVVAALLVPLAAACGGEEAPEGGPADSEVPPMTREEIQEAAEAMSPEVAESLGIVDTTIRIERPIPPESASQSPIIPDSAPPQ